MPACMAAGRLAHTRSAGSGVLSRNTRPAPRGEQVVALDEHRLVTGHEAGHALHQVAGADRRSRRSAGATP